MNKPIAAVLLSLVAAALAGAGAAAPAYGVTDRLKMTDGGWDYTSFDPVHGRVFISRGGGVTVIDVATKAVSLMNIPPGSGRMHESLPLDHGKLLLVTDGMANVAHLIDAATGGSVSDVPVGQKPDAAVFDPASGLAVVMNGHSGDVTLIDPAAEKAVATVTLGGSLEFAAADGKGKVFVAIEDQNQLAVVDTKAHALAGHFALTGCTGPGGVAYASNAGVLIVACANKVAKVINAADGADLGTLAIGAGPDAVIYDPARKLAFIPCGRDGVLEVIAVRGPKDVVIVQTATTQIGARTGAVDPATGALYLPTAKYERQANGLVNTVPGTYEVLIVTPGKAD